jgi:hypothetical protein
MSRLFDSPAHVNWSPNQSTCLINAENATTRPQSLGPLRTAPEILRQTSAFFVLI